MGSRSSTPDLGAEPRRTAWPRELDPARQARRALVAWTLALVAIVAVDRFVLGEQGPWEAIQRRIDRNHRFEWGIADDRLQLRRLRSAPPGQPRVLVAGSSQARTGFMPDWARLPPPPPEVAFAKTAHGGFNVFEMRSMVGRVLEADPDAAVLFLSPLDLNSPLQVLPQASFASWSAVFDLAREAGAAFAFAQRQTFYRLLAGNLLNGYRYRQVLDRAFAGRLRRAGLGFPAFGGSMIVAGGSPRKLTGKQRAELRAELARQFPKVAPAAAAIRFRRIHGITRGDHCRIQQGLVRRTVRRLTAADVRVVVVEAPLHPFAPAIYDATIRDDFLAFAAGLVRDFGVRFVPLEASGPFVSEDFVDPIHVGKTGSVKLTLATLAAVYEVLELSPPAWPPDSF